MKIPEASNLAVELMSKHGLITECATSWRLDWDNARRRFGLCNYRTRTISLSRPLVELNTVENVRDTILHEIAHALAGDFAGHGRIWKLQAMAIGARPETCVSSARIVTVPGRWVATCPNCQKRVEYHGKPRNRYACRECCTRHNGGRFSEQYQLVVTRNEAI